MKIRKILIPLALIWLPVAVMAQLPAYETALTPWPASFGNHRAIVQVNRPANAIRLRLTWRLHDQQPAQKRFLIIDATTGDTVRNVYRVHVSNESCDIVFGPVNRAGKYYFYYLPFKVDPDPGYYRYGYLPPEKPGADWLKHNHLTDPVFLSRLPLASCKVLQARTKFDSFYPMEIIPTEKEKSSFLSRHTDDYLLFSESRAYPIKMKDEIPLKWVNGPMKNDFTGIAEQNEYYTFQIGLYAARSDIDSVQVHFSDLTGPQTIPATALTCFNTGGINSYGKPFIRRLDVGKGKVQALWIGADIPAQAKPGKYDGTVTISAIGKTAKTIPVHILVRDHYLADRGDSEPGRYSRLRWLNSTIGISDKPTNPFTEISFNGENEFSLYGKEITVEKSTLPSSIVSWGNEVLASPISCEIPGEDFEEPQPALVSQDPGKIAGSWTMSSGNFTIQGSSTLEFDGFIHYDIRVKALHDADMRDFRLEIPFRKDIAQYMMGMGLPGTTVPNSLDAKWEGPHDSFWMGNTYGGLYCELLGSSYHGPLLNLYHPKPPASWYNDNKGGFAVRRHADGVVASVYAGERSMKKGDTVDFSFNLLVTPVKKLDPPAQFMQRYYHNGNNPWPDSGAVAAGIKVINIHQGNSYNPYINYPFLAQKQIRSFADHWHKKGMKVKIYYTIRELTDHTPELWALLSLNHEVLSGGKGGGYPWLQEHVVDGYTPAWYTPVDNDAEGNIDAALESASGDSRWYNFYIRGLAWLIENEDIDGLYLDDVSFDRHIIKRMREAMDSVKPGCLIDLHSNTGFSKGPATQYTAFFPYIDKLWFGESFQYDKMPAANWLVECAGIPFGLMGDMLQGGGNPWRGMIYGMTTRLPWSTEGVTCDPSSIWKIWDQFGIADAKMIGYWDKNAVVRTTNPDVLATAYVKDGKTLIALASWADAPVKVNLIVDWQKLGLNPQEIKLTAPAVENFQPAAVFSPDDAIPVDPKKGWLLITEKR